MHVKICWEHSIHMQYCSVLQPLCLHLLTVPGGRPENFTVDVISSTQILLMWRPPASEIHNGCVRLYTISVFEVQTGTNYSYILRTDSMSISCRVQEMWSQNYQCVQNHETWFTSKTRSSNCDGIFTMLEHTFINLQSLLYTMV